MEKDVKKFMAKGAILFLIVFSPFIIQSFFPIDYFNYRVWESLYFGRLGSGKPFYTDMYIEKVEEGDLGYRTEYAVKKKVVWQTDRYGFRNYPSEDDAYDVVIIGDSNIVGAGLSQEDTLASVLSRKSGLRVYAYASNNVNSNINKFLSEERFKKHPPKAVIVESIERHIQDLPALNANSSSEKKYVRLSAFEKPVERFDSILKMSMIRYYFAVAKEKIRPKKVIVNPDTGMIFYKLAFDNQGRNIVNFNKSLNRIVDYDGALKKRGIQFIFLPIPNKETIYYSDIPEAFAKFRKESPFLKQLIDKLDQSDIIVVHTLDAFKKNKQKGLFILDDTHWNANAVNLTADLLMKDLSGFSTVRVPYNDSFADSNFGSFIIDRCIFHDALLNVELGFSC